MKDILMLKLCEQKKTDPRRTDQKEGMWDPSSSHRWTSIIKHPRQRMDKRCCKNFCVTHFAVKRIYILIYFQMKFISSGHYDDIVTERSIEKLCGYPLCSEQKGEEIKQQFKIDTKTNRVYDLSDRKNFCCHKCLKHSMFLREQISQTPLWLRNGDEKPVTFYEERSSIFEK